MPQSHTSAGAGSQSLLLKHTRQTPLLQINHLQSSLSTCKPAVQHTLCNNLLTQLPDVRPAFDDIKNTYCYICRKMENLRDMFKTEALRSYFLFFFFTSRPDIIRYIFRDTSVILLLKSNPFLPLPGSGCMFPLLFI